MAFIGYVLATLQTAIAYISQYNKEAILSQLKYSLILPNEKKPIFSDEVDLLEPLPF